MKMADEINKKNLFHVCFSLIEGRAGRRQQGIGRDLHFYRQHVRHGKLDYLRVKIAAATRKWLVRRSLLRRSGGDEVDVVRLARPEGEVSR